MHPIELPNTQEAAAFVASRYNFFVPTAKAVLLYNARTGAVMRLTGADAERFARMLASEFVTLTAADLPASLLGELTGGGFLVASGTDELRLIRDEFWKARRDTPTVITLTTTMNCNLGCYYCYESRTPDKLEARDVASVVALIEEKLRHQATRRLHVDWYGGEPMLNMDFIEEASAAIQAFCARTGTAYQASIISNGTQWPADVGSFIARHQIWQAQISFDGLRENHNIRRRYRADYRPGPDASSFDFAVELVDQLLDHCRVDVRINLDRGNKGDLLPFVEFARERGWFRKKHLCAIAPARLAYYSERSAFMRTIELKQDEYFALYGQVEEVCHGDFKMEDSVVPSGFPYPRTWVCAALANQSGVVGAEGLLYRCGLQVGETHRAVGSLRPEANPGATFADKQWWDEFDPTTLPSCSRCSFLPVCWGGCPKKHLDLDQHALDQQSIYWRNHLARHITKKFGEEPPAGYTFSQEDQFR